MVDSALMGLLGLSALQAELASRETSQHIECKVRTLTRGQKYHFFGYYGICP